MNWGLFQSLGKFKFQGPGKFNILLIPIVLERAGSVPLNTRVFCESQSGVEEFWDAILPHVTRTINMSHKLEITLPLRRPLGILSKSQPLPKLQYLWLEWADGGQAGQINECIDLSQATSIALLSVSVRSPWPMFRQEEPTTNLRLRLPQVCMLKELRLTGRITVVDVILVVTCCASTLERLTLAIDAPNWAIREAQVPPNLQLSRLHHLRVVERFSVLLPTMSAPKLMSLTIHPGGSGSEVADWSQASLPKTPTFPALLKLRVPRKMPENVLMTYLVAHPTLQTVIQVNAAIAERALLADNSESHTRLLPNLRCLWISSRFTGEDVAILRWLAGHRRYSESRPKCILHLECLGSGPIPELGKLDQDFHLHPGPPYYAEDSLPFNDSSDISE
jgi:hypothetical protein